MTDSRSEQELQYRLSRHFFWATLVLASFTGLLLGSDPSAGPAPAIGASVVMLVYLLVSKLWTPLVLRHDDYADGFYYLGFLLTLVALVATLMSLGDVTGEDMQRVVLSRFGLALSTTIVGLGVRTALRMFGESERDAAPDALTRAQEDLRMASEDLRVVLQTGTTDMETTLGVVAQKIDSAGDGFSEKVLAVGTRIHEVGESLTPLSESFGTTESSVRALTEQLGAAQQRVQGLSESFGTAESSVRALTEQLGAAQQRVEGLRARVENVGVELTSLTVPIERSAKGLDALAASVSHVVGSSRQLLEIMTFLERRFGALDALAKQLEGLTDLGGSIEQMSEVVGSGRDSIRQFVHSIGEVEEALGGIREGVESIDFDSVAQLSGLMRQQLGVIQSSIHDWEKALSQLGEITKRLGEMEADAAGSLKDVQSEITSGVRYLRQIVSRGDG